MARTKKEDLEALGKEWGELEATKERVFGNIKARHKDLNKLLKEHQQRMKEHDEEFEKGEKEIQKKLDKIGKMLDKMKGD